MKVITEGKHPDNDPFRGTCRNCGCEIECTRRELKWTPDYSPREPSSPYVDCPTCGYMLWVRDAGRVSSPQCE